jgi:hypothetical protein
MRHTVKNPPKRILLEDLTWLEAEKVLTPTAAVVILSFRLGNELHLQLPPAGGWYWAKTLPVSLDREGGQEVASAYRVQGGVV